MSAADSVVRVGDVRAVVPVMAAADGHGIRAPDRAPLVVAPAERPRAAWLVRIVASRRRPVGRRPGGSSSRRASQCSSSGCWRSTRSAIPDDEPEFRVSENEALNLPARWDAGWYLNIADRRIPLESRIVKSASNRTSRSSRAIPLAIYLVGRFFGGVDHGPSSPPRVLLSHARVSLGARLSLPVVARSAAATRTAPATRVLLIATYPFAVFYGAIYTESLFLLGAVGAIYEFNARRWGRVAAWGVMVGLTRPNGFMLALTLARVRTGTGHVDAQGHLDADRDRLRSRHDRQPDAGRGPVLDLHRVLTGNPLQWSAQHAAWGRTFTGATPFVRSAEFAAAHGFEHYARNSPFELMNGVAAVFALAATIPVAIAAGIPVRHFHPVQHRAAAAGRRLHLDRTCDSDDVPDLHVAGARASRRERPSSSPSRSPCCRRWPRRCSIRGGRSSNVAGTDPRTPSVTDDTDNTDSEVSATSSSLEHAAA